MVPSPNKENDNSMRCTASCHNGNQCTRKGYDALKPATPLCKQHQNKVNAKAVVNNSTVTLTPETHRNQIMNDKAVVNNSTVAVTEEMYEHDDVPSDVKRMIREHCHPTVCFPPSSVVHVRYVNSIPVAAYCLNENTYVTHVCSRREYRGQGHMLDLMSNTLPKTVTKLDVEAGNKAALKLYKKLGYEQKDQYDDIIFMERFPARGGVEQKK
jgi:hypothetical protein